MISGNDGSVIWKLGGKHSMFTDITDGDKKASFLEQHHARLHGSILTLFDNGSVEQGQISGCTANCSRGLKLEIDTDSLTVKFLAEFLHPNGLTSVGRGGSTLLPNGNLLIAWGTQPAITEHKDEEVVMDIQVGPLLSDHVLETPEPYRAYKMNWEAYPPWGPDIVVENNVVYVSWNGATEVKEWIVVSDLQIYDI